MQRLSNAGLLEICEHEGIVPAPYLDSKGIWTAFVGHTAAAGPPDPAKMPRGMPIDMDAAIDRALEIYRKDVAKYEARVQKAITVPLKQHEFDALVSFDFNTGGIHRAKLTAEINSDDMSGDGFMGWLKPPEIRGRRMAEQRLFRTGDYAHNGDVIPIWKVDANGRLRGRHSIIRGADVLARMGRPVGALDDPWLGPIGSGVY